MNVLILRVPVGGVMSTAFLRNTVKYLRAIRGGIGAASRRFGLMLLERLFQPRAMPPQRTNCPAIQD